MISRVAPPAGLAGLEALDAWAATEIRTDPECLAASVETLHGVVVNAARRLGKLGLETVHDLSGSDRAGMSSRLQEAEATPRERGGGDRRALSVPRRAGAGAGLRS